jgi:hypothetical protein
MIDEEPVQVTKTGLNNMDKIIISMGGCVLSWHERTYFLIQHIHNSKGQGQCYHQGWLIEKVSLYFM